jgi:hypothetical protein
MIAVMTPVSSLTEAAHVMGLAFPMTYFVAISAGTSTKGLGLHRAPKDHAMFASGAAWFSPWRAST